MRQPARLIAGTDEAGRGALAGPVVAAAVILPDDHQLPGLTDSKKISRTRREQLFVQIQQQAIAWSISAVSAEVIDSINILQASLLAMRQAVEQLEKLPHQVLVDGNHLPKLTVPAEAVVGGDSLHACISAASILAKVHRDQLMVDMDARFPGYGFVQHKGYPTAQHLCYLQRLGPCAEHRCSYAPVRQLQLI